MKTPKAKPNPGSQEACKQGCTCPVMDNHNGQGIPSKHGPRFWINGDCPMHAIADTDLK
jgi:hypothetical protein